MPPLPTKHPEEFNSWEEYEEDQKLRIQERMQTGRDAISYHQTKINQWRSRIDAMTDLLSDLDRSTRRRAG